MQESSIEKNNVLTIWLGQLIVFSLKADRHDILLLRNNFQMRLKELLGIPGTDVQKKAIFIAVDNLCSLLGQKFSWDSNASQLLSVKMKNFCDNFIAAESFDDSLAELRVVDAWSGLASCLISCQQVPLSLVDYILEVLLPVLTGDWLTAFYKTLNTLFVADRENQDVMLDIEQHLDVMVKRLCFNAFPNKSACNQFKLAILMHLPKGDEETCLKMGYVYKILQAKYNHEEDE